MLLLSLNPSDSTGTSGVQPDDLKLVLTKTSPGALYNKCFTVVAPTKFCNPYYMAEPETRLTDMDLVDYISTFSTTDGASDNPLRLAKCSSMYYDLDDVGSQTNVDTNFDL